jgi:hypothetical protein
MVMNEIGPFIPFGAPNEAVPEVGAACLYAADSEWQNAVQYLLGRARLVVLRIGRTEGFWWEQMNTVSYRKPQEVLLLIPRDEQLYEDFQRNSRDLLPCDLPRLTGWNYRKLGRGSLMAALFFDPDWAPNVVELQTYSSLPFFPRSPAYALVPVLKMALGPFYQHLGVAWKRPRISWRLIMTLASVVPLAGVVALRLDESGVSFCYDDAELRSATGEARWRAFIAAGANGSSVGGGGARCGTYGRDPRFPGPAGADDPIGRVSGVTARRGENACTGVWPDALACRIKASGRCRLALEAGTGPEDSSMSDSADCAAFSRGTVSGGSVACAAASFGGVGCRALV